MFLMIRFLFPKVRVLSVSVVCALFFYSPLCLICWSVPLQGMTLYSDFSTSSLYAVSDVSFKEWPSSCLLCLSLIQQPTLCFEEVVAICSETVNYLPHRLEGKVYFTKIDSQPQKNNKGQFIISTVGGRKFEIANHKFCCTYQHA